MHGGIFPINQPEGTIRQEEEIVCDRIDMGQAFCAAQPFGLAEQMIHPPADFPVILKQDNLLILAQPFIKRDALS